MSPRTKKKTRAAAAPAELPMPIRDLEPDQRAVIVGKTGKGKSTFAKRFGRVLLVRGRRVLCFDPHNEFSAEGVLMPGVELGPLDMSVSIDEFLDDEELLEDSCLSLSVVPSDDWRQRAKDFEAFAAVLKRHQLDTRARQPLVLLVDEVGTFEEYCRPAMTDVATQFRHYGVGVCLLAQRMTQVTKTARVQASEIVTFCQDDDEDLAALRSRFGDLADSARDLQRGEFLHWREGHAPRAHRKAA